MEHREITLDEIRKVEAFIKDAMLAIPEDEPEQLEFYKNILETSKAAKAHATNNEKLCYLYSAATQWANKLMFFLFEHNAHTEAIEKAYRELESMKVAGTLVQEYDDERKAKEDALVEQMRPLHEERQDIGVFIGILNGKKPAEAKKQQAEYEAKVQQAMQQQAMQGGAA